MWTLGGKGPGSHQGQSSSAGFDAGGEQSASTQETVQAVRRAPLLPWKMVLLPSAPRAALGAQASQGRD